MQYRKYNNKDKNKKIKSIHLPFLRQLSNNITIIIYKI